MKQSLMKNSLMKNSLMKNSLMKNNFITWPWSSRIADLICWNVTLVTILNLIFQSEKIVLFYFYCINNLDNFIDFNLEAVAMYKLLV